MEISHRSTSPNDSLKHLAPWIFKLWSGHKWDENMVTKIIELVNTNSLKAIGSGAIRDQWGSFAFSFMSKFENLFRNNRGPSTWTPKSGARNKS